MALLGSAEDPSKSRTKHFVTGLGKNLFLLPAPFALRLSFIVLYVAKSKMPTDVTGSDQLFSVASMTRCPVIAGQNRLDVDCGERGVLRQSQKTVVLHADS